MNACKCTQRTLLGLLVALLLLPTLALSGTPDPTPVERPLNYEFVMPQQSAKSDPGDYTGFIRLYVVEPESRFTTYGTKYQNGFLNLPIDSSITLSDGSRHYRRYIWNHNLGGIQSDNIAVISTIVNDDPYTAYAKPPSSNPFVALYVDATAYAAAGETDSNKTTEGFTHTVFVEEYTRDG
ncbi:MAG: hypothetical protein KOO62_06865 [candidate division Zixibacteria bacterium]|nr:hypothetical protein [candidate division Zixibacteria bacterium]